MIRGIPIHSLVALMLLFGSATLSSADDGDPLAIRCWPGGAVSVETHWGLDLLVDPRGTANEELRGDVDHVVSPTAELDHYLSRQPNAASVAWIPATDVNQADPNAIHVRTHRRLGNSRSVLIEVDGTRILFISSEWFSQRGDRDSTEVNLQGLENPEMVILDIEDLGLLSTKGTAFLLKFVRPKAIMFNRKHADQATLASLKEHFGADQVIDQRNHNTIALSNTNSNQPQRVFVTTDTPWTMPEELHGLFAAMEKANKDSQAVFAKLSVGQLNFRPANGTHTPRWNTEHMMGRQLLFFSQIYHALDPTIPVIDLNPKQMPPDYVFRHPDWDGGEEARQTQRVSEFTRRFAYLLDGVELDSKAPGSRWTLFGLLKQMERHYGEHTANTINKFGLPGWPAR